MIRNIFRNHRSSDEGISPVIGTILMVAATVIIAGAVYAAVNAYSGHASKPANDVSFKAQSLDTNNDGIDDAVKVTYLSGPSSIIPGVTEKTTPAAGSPMTCSGSTAAACTAGGSWSVGDFATYSLAAAAPAGTYTVYSTVTLGTNTVLDQTLTLTK